MIPLLAVNQREESSIRSALTSESLQRNIFSSTMIIRGDEEGGGQRHRKKESIKKKTLLWHQHVL